MSRRYAVIGQNISHTLSPELHGIFAKYTSGYQYEKLDIDKTELEQVLHDTRYSGFNVTMPHKREVTQYLDEISEEAQELNAVNTIRRMPDGRLFGYNTDVYGFEMLAGRKRIQGRKVLVFGTGGAASAIVRALRNMGAKEIVIVSRTPRKEAGYCIYEELGNHLDAQVLVNATPVGMYPHAGKSPLDGYGISPTDFTNLESAFDAIYRPYRTKFIMDAETAGAYARSGLAMLVYQGLQSAQIWGEVPKNGMGRKVIPCRPKGKNRNRRGGSRNSRGANHRTIRIHLGKEAHKYLLRRQLNITVVGMPGCGKSSISRQMAIRMKRPFLDIDRKITEKYGISPGEMIETQGEEVFRKCETQVLCEICSENGQVIATGGGVVTRPENLPIMRSNSVVIYLKRPTRLLARKGRPITASVGVEELYRRRAPLYEAAADICIENNHEFGKARGKHPRNRQNSYIDDCRAFAGRMRKMAMKYIEALIEEDEH